MNRHKIESSNIAEVGYDPEKAQMEIKFASGALYRYPNISPMSYAMFMAADSQGKYFARYLRHAPCERVLDVDLNDSVCEPDIVTTVRENSEQSQISGISGISEKANLAQSEKADQGDA